VCTIACTYYYLYILLVLVVTYKYWAREGEPGGLERWGGGASHSQACQDSARTLPGLCQDYARSMPGLAADHCQLACLIFIISQTTSLAQFPTRATPRRSQSRFLGQPGEG
jgi:hypothetical protein